MKFLLFFILASISLLLITSCTKDDDGNNDSDNAEYTAQYKQVIKDIAQCKANLADLREEAKGLSGGRFIVVQEQIAREAEKLSELIKKKNELEEKLGLALSNSKNTNHLLFNTI